MSQMGFHIAFDNKYCSKCSYPLIPQAYDEIKEKEETRIKKLEEEIQSLKESGKEIRECLIYPEKLGKISIEK